MYVYNYRLFDRYDREVASFAILTDDRPHWRPTEFAYELWGSRAGLTFPVVKLLDYRERWAALEASTNPFALLVMAHLKAQETAHDPDARYHWKFQLLRQLYTRGYTRQTILELFRFIDWLLILPDELERSLASDIEQLEEQQQMPYVTSIERIGIKKGRQEGLQEGLQKGEAAVIVRLLQRRFADLSPHVRDQISRLELARLEALSEALLDFQSLTDVKTWLNQA